MQTRDHASRLMSLMIVFPCVRGLAPVSVFVIRNKRRYYLTPISEGNKPSLTGCQVATSGSVTVGDRSQPHRPDTRPPVSRRIPKVCRA